MFQDASSDLSSSKSKYLLSSYKKNLMQTAPQICFMNSKQREGDNEN